MFNAVLFDFNGVLVDDEELHRLSFHEVLVPHGLSMSAEAYAERYLGFDDRGAFEAVFRDHQRALTETLLHALIEQKSHVYEARAQQELRLFPGAAELVRECAQHALIAVVSGALRAEIHLGLARLGVTDCVKVIVPADDVQAGKPDPEGYRKGVEQLRAFAPTLQPSQCVAIEDSLAGIQSARSAGLHAVGVAHTYPQEQLLQAGAQRVFATIAALNARQLLQQ